MRKYIDFDLIDKYPNKYNLEPKDIKKLKILDWGQLKKHTWFNEAMLNSGNWWCHLEGCQKDGAPYNEEDEFWIGFNEDNDEINFHFNAHDGMCRYNFRKFYSIKYINNEYDMLVQVNSLRWITKMIDLGVLGL